MITPDWHRPESGLWGERYFDEHQNILTDERTVEEMKILHQLLGEKSLTILDAPCGFGRFSNELAMLGHEVTGVDLDPYFIDLAKSKAQERNVAVDYSVADISTLDMGRKFGAVLNLFTSIGYLEDDGKNANFIGKLCDHVDDNGKLVLETINPYGLLKNYLAHDEQTTPKGVRISYDRSFDAVTATNREKITYNYPDGKTQYGEHRIRMYMPHELVNIMGENGLEMQTMLSDDGTEYTPDTFRMWMIFSR